MHDIPMVELRNVSRWYGEIIGINRITVTLRPGITGLLGPNGAGKSTVMNLIAGMLEPSMGDVLVFGDQVWRNPRQMVRLGYCAQSDAFYEKMSGLDFIQSLLQLRGWMKSRARAAAEHALNQLGMTPNMNRRIQGYSKGMRQRTKVALAIAHNPEILVLDEPLNGLDAMGRHEMIELIRNFGQEGRNVIISSHVLHEIEAMTDNILMMNGGYLLAEGEVREVRGNLSEHPHQVLIRCAGARAAAVHLMTCPSTLSVRLQEEDNALVVETRNISAFYDDLSGLILDRGIDVSLVTVADENITSIFDYLSGNRGGQQPR